MRVFRFILHAKKTAFVIEHDFIMATYLADRVIVFEGKPAIAATATPYATFTTMVIRVSPYRVDALQTSIPLDRYEQILGFSRNHLPS